MDEFPVVVVVLFLLFTAPISVAVVTSRITRYPMPRRGVFVAMSSLVSYGFLTFGTALAAGLEWIATLAGPPLSMAGHASLFEATRYIREYVDGVAILAMLVAAFVVPIKASKRWAGVVSAWAEKAKQ
jgi:hypothetical protein